MVMVSLYKNRTLTEFKSWDQKLEYCGDRPDMLLVEGMWKTFRLLTRKTGWVL